MLLPQSVRLAMIRWFLSAGRSKGCVLHPSVFEATLDLVNPVSVGNSLYMAYTELLEVGASHSAPVSFNAAQLLSLIIP